MKQYQVYAQLIKEGKIGSLDLFSLETTDPRVNALVQFVRELLGFSLNDSEVVVSCKQVGIDYTNTGKYLPCISIDCHRKLEQHRYIYGRLENGLFYDNDDTPLFIGSEELLWGLLLDAARDGFVFKGYKCSCGCGCSRRHHNPTGSYCRSCAAGCCGE